jgi:mannosyl-glycoprotein endo-beta-N-acetylglucosaminidase
MGVDVFGRGSYGGGGFGVHLALSAAREMGLSAALFAPGWVQENLEKARFHELQDKWWLQVRGGFGGVGIKGEWTAGFEI